MIIKKKVLFCRAVLFLACIFLSYYSLAQKFDDAFFLENLSKTSYSIDSDADAIVLYEKCDIHINPYGNGYNQVYHLHRIIKILKNTSQILTLGDVVEVYPNDGRADIFTRNIKASAYNLEGGKMVITPFDGKTAYDKKIDHHYHEMAFAIPAVKEGSIIDYEFEVVTRLFIILPMWEFQSRVPKLVSEYEVVSPNEYRFNSIRHGGKPFKDFSNIKDAQAEQATSYHITSHASDNKYSILWGRTNMRAVKEEPFISSIDNYREVLALQISGYAGNQYLASWKEYDDDIMHDKYFGKQITNANNFLDPVVDSLTKNDDTPLKKAKSIFSYVRSNFECNNFHSLFADEEISKVFENKQGNDAAINLLLTAMLKKSGINAAPVELSKVGHMRAVESYPFVNMFNYVVCLATIDSTRYYLDATDKFNRFGTLPVYCYNGYGRVIDEKGYGITLTAKNINDKDFYKVNISRITDSSMHVEVTERKGVINGIKLRNEIIKDSSALKKYIHKHVEEQQVHADVINISIDNLNDPEKDLAIRYSLLITRPASESVSYFNGDMFKFFTHNPFSATHRELPMEFKNKCDYTYSMDMLLPNWLNPEDLPESLNINVNGDGLNFEHNVSYDSSLRMLSVTAKFNVNETTYPVVDYEQVKAFFDKMIQAQNSVLVLKKTGNK